MPALDELGGERRLNEPDRYDVLDTSTEESFDRITRLVCRLFGVEMAAIAFLDGRRQWFKSRQGLSAAETSREISLCLHTVAQGGSLIVPDTLDDLRFRCNPLVCGGMHLRFYAGADQERARRGHRHAMRVGCAAAIFQRRGSRFAVRPRQAWWSRKWSSGFWPPRTV
jgi:hypothetical protein